MSQSDLFAKCQVLIERGERFVLATLVNVTGSTPQDQGAKMIATRDGLAYGTIGGGRLEAKTLDAAQEMLAGGIGARFVDWSLKADVGMTCGGRVAIYLELVGADTWPIYVFGAGHVSQALADLLVKLPCQVTCIDPRQEWLEKLPAMVKRVHLEEPSEYVGALPDNAYVLCMTKGHRTDFPVLQALLNRENPVAYIGVIGSDAKAAVLRKELANAGTPAGPNAFYCPVGMPIGTNHPAEIAVSIAAQLLEVRDRRQSSAE